VLTATYCAKPTGCARRERDCGCCIFFHRFLDTGPWHQLNCNLSARTHEQLLQCRREVSDSGPSAPGLPSPCCPSSAQRGKINPLLASFLGSWKLKHLCPAQRGKARLARRGRPLNLARESGGTEGHATPSQPPSNLNTAPGTQVYTSAQRSTALPCTALQNRQQQTAASLPLATLLDSV
jgi:hypothetical protein